FLTLPVTALKVLNCLLLFLQIISLLLLGFSLFSHGHLHQQEEAEREIAVIHVMYVIAAVIILLTIFGAIGVWKEIRWALIVYAVGMILSSLLMLGLNIQGLASQSQVRQDVKKQYLNLLPLVNATEFLDDIQTECCGLESYRDWKFNIPNSCLCTDKSTNPCVTNMPTLCSSVIEPVDIRLSLLVVFIHYGGPIDLKTLEC
uniref:Tetraspanin-8 n=1 Tax=Maylandia zebra TaxID=106582 RepID=A0A3P9BX04_9CICH